MCQYHGHFRAAGGVIVFLSLIMHPPPPRFAACLQRPDFLGSHELLSLKLLACACAHMQARPSHIRTQSVLEGAAAAAAAGAPPFLGAQDGMQLLLPRVATHARSASALPATVGGEQQAAAAGSPGAQPPPSPGKVLSCLSHFARFSFVRFGIAPCCSCCLFALCALRLPDILLPLLAAGAGIKI
jgi:hypothetical protein